MPATLASDLARYLDDNDRRFHDELFDFLRIPSVSARSEFDGDMQRTAKWVADNLIAAGLSAEIMPTPGHPVVLGEWRKAPPGAPTVLVYGHYDVQPAEPLELWTTPPFEPTIRDGRIYARGSVDDKGQLFAHMKAIEAHLKTRGKLPVNIVVLAEGEEEVGSDNLEAFVTKQAKRLACDYVVVPAPPLLDRKSVGRGPGGGQPETPGGPGVRGWGGAGPGGCGLARQR